MVRTAEFLSLTRLSRNFVLNGSLQCIVDFNDIRLWFKDYGSKGKAAGKRGVDGHVVTRRKLHIFAHFCSYSAVSSAFTFVLLPFANIHRKGRFILEKTTVVFEKTSDVSGKTLDVFGKTSDVFDGCFGWKKMCHEKI